jgi:predicted transcriptional regulator
MARTTVRVTEATRETLRELAQESHQTMQAVLERAVEAYYREVFLERTNVEYAKLREDPVAWAEEMEERRAWGIALRDAPNEG